jgi:hypothetical protein
MLSASTNAAHEIIPYDDSKQAGIEHALSILSKDNRISSSVVQALEDVVKMWKRSNMTTGDDTYSREGSEQDEGKRMQSEDEGSGELPSSPNADLAHQDAKNQALSRRFKPPSSKMLQLSAEDACEIYKMRPRNSKERRGSMVQCKTIAPKYGVSAKTIRDIWRGRTWILATKHLWSEEEIAERGDGDNSACPANAAVKAEAGDKQQPDRSSTSSKTFSQVEAHPSCLNCSVLFSIVLI